LIRERDKSYSIQAIETKRQLASLPDGHGQTCSLDPCILAYSDLERIRRCPESGCGRIICFEGCSSCLPADEVLAELWRQPQKNWAELILLGEHVDHSNYIGWTDRLSSAQLIYRQSNYACDFHLASPCTPQTVIDERVQFVSNNLDDVCQEIAGEAKQPKRR
jgi:hypothetical protein